MAKSVAARRPMALDGFLAFLERRPNGERWWLDDGVPVTNPLRTRRRDWIQPNILSTLLTHWRSRRPAWRPAGPTRVPVPGRDRTVAPDALVAPEPERDDVSITPDPMRSTGGLPSRRIDRTASPGVLSARTSCTSASSG